MKLAIAALLLTGCSYTYVGVVETASFEETSRCGGRYQVVTHCDAYVGPWPLTEVFYPRCRTSPYPDRESVKHGPTVLRSP